MSVLEIFKNFDPYKVLEKVNNKNRILRFLVFLFGIFIMAVAFNICFVPNNLVIGGISGLAILVSHITNISAANFIFFTNLFLIGLSLVLLGKVKSFKNIIGALCFSIFVFLTQDINKFLQIEFSDTLLLIIFAAFIYGIGAGLVFKAGYSSGGGDIIGLIVSEYTKKPIGKTMSVINVIIILLGGVFFGYTMVMYAIIINYITTVLIDKIILGISNSKMFLIETSKEDEVKEFMMKVMKSGVTILKAKGGYSKQKKDMLMCIVRTKDYFALKEVVKEIDPDAFIIVSDCYEVYGGTKRKEKVSI